MTLAATRRRRRASRAATGARRGRAHGRRPGHRSVATLGGNLCLDTRCVFYNQSEWWRAANDYCLKRGGDVCHVAPQGKHCHAAFCGDLAPALLALGAEVELVARPRHAPHGARRSVSRRRRRAPDARARRDARARARSGADRRPAYPATARRASAARSIFRWPAWRARSRFATACSPSCAWR